MDCVNCGAGLSSFTMYYNNGDKPISKYGNCCSFTCSADYHDKDVANNPDNYEKVEEISPSGTRLTYFKKIQHT